MRPRGGAGALQAVLPETEEEQPRGACRDARQEETRKGLAEGPEGPVRGRRPFAREGRAAAMRRRQLMARVRGPRRPRGGRDGGRPHGRGRGMVRQEPFRGGPAGHAGAYRAGKGEIPHVRRVPGS